MKILLISTRILATGFTFFYFSELLFWARMRPGDSPGGWLATWAVYSFLAFLFLWIVQHFRVRTVWAVFLAGAAFGWMAEGIIVQTTYDQLPFSISFTGLAWHALITMVVGWYLIRKDLASQSVRRLLILCVLIGMGYGLWSISWWIEPDGGVSTWQEYSLYSFIATGLAILAYRLVEWSSAEPFKVNRWVVIAAAAALVLYTLLVTIPAQPLAAIILPMLAGILYLGLSWNRESEEAGSILDEKPEPVRAAQYALLLIIPTCASLVYLISISLGLEWRTNLILYILTMPLGFAALLLCIFKVWKRRFKLEKIIPSPEKTS